MQTRTACMQSCSEETSSTCRTASPSWFLGRLGYQERELQRGVKTTASELVLEQKQGRFCIHCIHEECPLMQCLLCLWKERDSLSSFTNLLGTLPLSKFTLASHLLCVGHCCRGLTCVDSLSDLHKLLLLFQNSSSPTVVSLYPCILVIYLLSWDDFVTGRIVLQRHAEVLTPNTSEIDLI